jgi:L-threonylcarbamoyladenylate synthase
LRRTLVLKVDPVRPDEKEIALCADMLKRGGLVAFPTETVYGIAANLLDARAIDRLYKIKARPRGKPFTVHIADSTMLEEMGTSLTGAAKLLSDKFWPGPLTMIMKADTGDNIGFRMPRNNVAINLIRSSGVPVVAPSANISGRRPPRTPAEVLEQLDGKVDILLDAGPVDVGIESTVVDLTATPYRILREGAISKEEIESTVTGSL